MLLYCLIVFGSGICLAGGVWTIIIGMQFIREAFFNTAAGRDRSTRRSVDDV